MKLKGGVSCKICVENEGRVSYKIFGKNEGGVLKVHIYFGKINTEYSCREPFFEIYVLRRGHTKLAKKQEEKFIQKSRKTRGGVLKILNYWQGRISYTIRDKKQGWGGGSLEVNLGRFRQDITAERHYWR